MSSINALNASTSISCAYSIKSNQLSEETKAKLQALGINPTTVSSEAEAQSLIAQVEAMSKTDQARPQSNSSDQTLLTRAKDLAEEVGVKVSQTDTTDEICEKIAQKIEQLVAQCGNDSSQMSNIEEYQRELASIDSRYSTKIDSQESIFAAMNMISASNKYALGLK